MKQLILFSIGLLLEEPVYNKFTIALGQLESLRQTCHGKLICKCHISH